MKRGEELTIDEVEGADFGEDFQIAVVRVKSGDNVYIAGPPGSGKTTMLRKIGLYMSKLGVGNLYVKLEWVKYGWGLVEYVEKIYGKPTDGKLVLLDDGELIWNYGGAYRNLLRDLGSRQVVAAFRDIYLEAVREMFGEGVVIYLNTKHTEPVVKIPLGFNFLGLTKEITVI